LLGQDQALIGDSRGGVQRPEQVLGNPYGDRSSLTQYLNTAAFARPEVGALGNMRPNNIEGPGTWQLDLALTRAFRFTEAQRLEVRGEAFNVTNSLRPGNPITNFRNRLFGQINTSSDARVMQFVLKYLF
jgi:hypothetical protein